MSFEDVDELRDRLRKIVSECVTKGPGYAQEGVILQKARIALDPRTLAHEQLILAAWHRLFVDGELEWGYDLDNPRAPFFHPVVHQSVTAGGTE